MKIKTNNVPRPLITYNELPDKWRKEFGYIVGIGAEYDLRFVKFKGGYMDALDTQRITTCHGQSCMGWEYVVGKEHPVASWHAIAHDSHFSGTLFKFNWENEAVIVGEYTT